MSKKKSEEISEYEDQIFSCLKREPERMYVHLNNDQDRSVWTMKVHQESANLPLVMLHGMGAGIGLWLKNIEELSIDRSLYAFDLPGFGRSFRDKYQNFKTAEEAENFFTDAIETWRKSMSLNAFILLGHSFGGYLASAYALKYPAHVKGLILVDAWGFSRRQKENLHLSRRFKLGLAVYKTLSPNPLSFLRAAGSWGPSLINRYRPDIVRKYQHGDLGEGVIANYVYHCNALEPSGEIAFKSMVEELGWASRPMVERIDKLQPQIPVAMVNGKESWVDHKVCEKVKQLREKSFVHVELVNKAGHHVYADQPEHFNRVVRNICDRFDSYKNPSTSSLESGCVSLGEEEEEEEEEEEVNEAFKASRDNDNAADNKVCDKNDKNIRLTKGFESAMEDEVRKILEEEKNNDNADAHVEKNKATM